MERDLVRLRRPVPAPFLGAHVDDDRALELEDSSERLKQRVQVVAGHHPDVGDPEILEQLARRRKADHRSAEPLAPFERAPTDNGKLLDQAVVGGLALLPGLAELDLGEVCREGANGRADRHLVVVQDDEQLGSPMPDVVEGLE